MKKLILSLVIIVSITSTLSAQHKGKGHKNNRMNYLKELNLTPEQESKLKELRVDLKQNNTELKNNPNLSDLEKKDKRKELFKEHKLALGNILTPEQQAQIQELKGKKHEGKGKREGTPSKCHKQNNLNPETAEQLKALKENYAKEKKAIEMSRIAPAAQERKLEELTKKFKEEKAKLFSSRC